MSLRMVTELRRRWRRPRPAARSACVVLRGAGGHFCAGGDLKDMAAARMKARRRRRGRAGRGQRAVRRAVRRLCAHAAGARRGARRHGDGRRLRPRLRGRRRARRRHAWRFACRRRRSASCRRRSRPSWSSASATRRPSASPSPARRLDAGAALAIGLVHEVHARAPRSTRRWRGCSTSILPCAPDAIAQTKRLVALRPLHAAGRSGRTKLPRCSRARLQGAEGIEGTTAFLQKRKPNWAPQ